MAKQHHEWFVWPKNSQTNHAVARYLQNGDNRFEESALRDVLCSDEQKRDLWQCTETQAYFLWRNPELKLRIFNRLGAHGRVRDVTFLFSKDRRSPGKKRRRSHAKARK